MSMQEVRDLMSADYRKYCADLYAKFPAQEQNRAHYEGFEAKAALGVMARNVRLKSGTIEKGRVVLYVPDPENKDMVTVWYQGCMCVCAVRRSALKAA